MEAPAKEKPGWTAIALVAAFVVAAVGMFAVAARLVKRSPGPDISTIAVAPFSDLSPIAGESLGAQFATQLADTVSKTEGLHLTPASQAGSLIEGSVQRSGDRLHVAVWLVRASDRRALWAHRYEFPAKDPAGVRNEIVHGVANALHLQPGVVAPK